MNKSKFIRKSFQQSVMTERLMQAPRADLFADTIKKFIADYPDHEVTIVGDEIILTPIKEES